MRSYSRQRETCLARSRRAERPRPGGSRRHGAFGLLKIRHRRAARFSPATPRHAGCCLSTPRTRRLLAELFHEKDARTLVDDVLRGSRRRRSRLSGSSSSSRPGACFVATEPGPNGRVGVGSACIACVTRSVSSVAAEPRASEVFASVATSAPAPTWAAASLAVSPAVRTDSRFVVEK